MNANRKILFPLPANLFLLHKTLNAVKRTFHRFHLVNLKKNRKRIGFKRATLKYAHFRYEIIKFIKWKLMKYEEWIIFQNKTSNGNFPFYTYWKWISQLSNVYKIFFHLPRQKINSYQICMYERQQNFFLLSFNAQKSIFICILKIK